MNGPTASTLGEAERQRVLAAGLPGWTKGAVRQARPVVVFVVGQPGAGKTEVANLVQAALDRRGGAVRVCRDLYKAAHPRYAELLAADVRVAGVEVRPDTAWWQAEVERHVRAQGFDAVVESAFADADEAREASAAYRRSGHRIEIVAVATAEALAQLGVLDRYLTGSLRYVSWENQDMCAQGLLDTLTVVEEERLADRVAVVRRGMGPLYDNELTREGDWRRTAAAAAAARAERRRPWTAPQTKVFRRELASAEVRVHDARLPADVRLAVSRDAERAAAAAEPVRRIAHPLPNPPGTGYHRLGAEEHRWVFDDLIAPAHLRRVVFRPDPTVVYLVGEPGAGQLLAGRMLRRAMRPRPVRIEPDFLRGAHPDYFRLVTDSPRTADELVRPDTQAWQTEAEAYVREQRGDVTIETDFTCVDDFLLSAARFARARYRIEVVALAGRAADTRQSTFVRHARALELGAHTTLPTPAAHERACRTAAGIVAAAAADPALASVTVLNSDLHALGRGRMAPWALAAERLRPYTEQEAGRFHAVQRALHQALPRMREEIAGLAVQAQPLMPAWMQPPRIAPWPPHATALPLPTARAHGLVAHGQ
ncbi:zeta toxin family protein [Streptomyces roseolus]|uniref:zeta toxin family protein n=1 Tax=Streptomyces roseolus TaxID=67358 RepID=UPI0037A49BD1